MTPLCAAATPAQFCSENIKKTLFGQRDQMNRKSTFTHFNGVKLIDGKPDLAIEGQHDIGGFFRQLDFNFRGMRHNQRTIG